MKKICIFGDSWACGEWGWDSETNEYKVLHCGLQAFLSKNHDVTNLGQGGISNAIAIEKLKDALQQNTFDYIFWFKTDPLRDLRPYNRFYQTKLSFSDIEYWSTDQSLDAYRTLDNLRIPIICIGGAGKLCLDKMKNFSNLVPYIPSLIEMLYPHYKHSTIWFSDWIRYVGKQFDLESIEKFSKLKNNQDNLQFKPYRELFYPDGKHPNRHAHEILYKKICKDFNL